MNCKTITVSVVIIWLFLTSSIHSTCVWMLLSFSLICCNSCTWKMVLPGKKKNLFLFFTFGSFWQATFYYFLGFFYFLIWPLKYETFFIKMLSKLNCKLKVAIKHGHTCEFELSGSRLMWSQLMFSFYLLWLVRSHLVCPVPSIDYPGNRLTLLVLKYPGNWFE